MKIQQNYILLHISQTIKLNSAWILSIPHLHRYNLWDKNIHQKHLIFHLSHKTAVCFCHILQLRWCRFCKSLLCLTMNPVHWRYVGHTVLICFSALRGRLSQRQCWTRTPPALPSRLRRAKEIPAGFASASLTGLSVEMPVISQPGVVECKTVAERAAVWVLSVGTGDVVVLGARSVRRLQELGRSRIGQWAPTPLALVVRLGSLSVKSRILQNRRSIMEITTPGWNLQVTALGRKAECVCDSVFLVSVPTCLRLLIGLLVLACTTLCNELTDDRTDLMQV